MYVVVSFRTLRVQMKIYMATQLDINPSTNTILNMHPYSVYLKESLYMQSELLLLTIIKARPAYSVEATPLVSSSLLWYSDPDHLVTSSVFANLLDLCKDLQIFLFLPKET